MRYSCRELRSFKHFSDIGIDRSSIGVHILTRSLHVKMDNLGHTFQQSGGRSHSTVAGPGNTDICVTPFHDGAVCTAFNKEEESPISFLPLQNWLYGKVEVLSGTRRLEKL